MCVRPRVRIMTSPQPGVFEESPGRVCLGVLEDCTRNHVPLARVAPVLWLPRFFNPASGGGSMRVIPVMAVHQGFGTTSRRDAWWAAPSAVFVGLSLFVVYATWAAFQGAHYTFGPYLSPFYSPELFGDSPHAWFGPKPGWLARVAAVLAGAPDPAVPGALPVHLLLLPRRLLQGVLGRSAVVRRRRAAHRATGASARFR